jgi:sRNA-binding carbon storage regulator CsrA
MLQLTLAKDDYVMIGDDIRIQYARNNGKDTFSIAVDAPRDVKISRKSVYEENVEALAATGDPSAQILAEWLIEEAAGRRAHIEYGKAKKAVRRV